MRTGFECLQGQVFFSLHHIQTGSGANSSFYPVGTGFIFSES